MRSIKFRSWNGQEFGYFADGKYDEIYKWEEVHCVGVVILKSIITYTKTQRF